MANKGDLIYEGKAKKIFKTDDTNALFVEYLNQATALNGKKKDTIENKGKLNNQITSLLFQKVKENGIDNHFIEQVSETEQLIKPLNIIPLEVIVRNIATGSFSKRYGVENGLVLKRPLVEFFYKNDDLDDPLIPEDDIEILDIATRSEIDELKENALKVNKVLVEIFDKIGIKLVDFKLEFGKTTDGKILLGDEISPDTCRLWDKNTNASLDKDLYRKDTGDIIEVYEEVLSRLKNL